MNTPPLLIGAALIFWGWQTGLWLFAIPMAVIIEVARFISWRWEFSAKDVRRVANLCLIILISLFIYLFIQNPSFYFVYTLLQWLPVVLFPLLILQTYSVDEYIHAESLFLLFKSEKSKENKQLNININYPYFAICILSASNANSANISFYLGMLLLIAIALYSMRSKRFPPLVWLCLLLTAGSIGFIGQIGLHQLHLSLENHVVIWLGDGSELSTNSAKKQTNIGDIGVLKRSNEIVLRVATENQQTPPRLLSEATYNKYKSSIWVAAKPNFTVIKPEANGTTWNLGNQPANSSKITIYTNLRGGQGLLTLPDGTFKINELAVNQLEKNKFGGVKVAGKANDITYQAYFNNQLSLDNPPTAEDLEIPNQEKPALNQILNQLNITGKSPPEIVNSVDIFFLKNFTYSLQLTGKDNYATPISTFLLKNRAGHCEYFATATTLLLRAAGIPARYAVGYSVHEFSNLEKQYIVRSRHAHAWTMVYLDGKWQVLDTTPADWTNIEDAAASKLSLITDFWSLLSFKISQFLRNNSELKYVWWLIFPLVFILIWRFGQQKGARRISKPKKALKPSVKSELVKKNSEIDLIEKALSDLGLNRNPAESWKNWINRLKKDSIAGDLVDDIVPIIELYYRDRFDPAGIKENEKTILKSAIEAWLDKHHRAY
ncbi:transglutaminase [[Phormidium ambiguum] IAM M-71]|uniref:Transglutaminase n=1 Tax=[Phormidium ambiguum] IAM M-71 TaxID=454136 RepID=A0A1U7IEW0_9CYAN|nr:transglutaminase-like domain-containing protein [Phormidium ambiguum]OKH35534.1 transglutaminase [Phormidium ambiguum IAM M-71]